MIEKCIRPRSCPDMVRLHLVAHTLRGPSVEAGPVAGAPPRRANGAPGSLLIDVKDAYAQL